jgi:peptide deformylase
MTVRPVLTYPDPFLKTKVGPSNPNDPRIKEVLQDLVDTMTHHPGCVGIAAPQLAYAERCIVVNVSRSSRAEENHGLLRLVNPIILESSQWKVGREGCLSFPDLLANVKRAQKIRFGALNGDLIPFEMTSTGFEAVAIQHELDHLDGLLFLDRIRSSKDLFERRKQVVEPV